MNNKDIIKKILTFSVDNDFEDASRREKFANDLRSFIVMGSQESKGFVKAMVGSFYKTEKEPPKPPPADVPAEEPTTETPTEEIPAEEPTTETPAEEPTTETPTEEIPAEEPTTETPNEEEDVDSMFSFPDIASMASSVKNDTNKQESVDFMGFYFK